MTKNEIIVFDMHLKVGSIIFENCFNITQFFGKGLFFPGELNLLSGNCLIYILINNYFL